MRRNLMGISIIGVLPLTQMPGAAAGPAEDPYEPVTRTFDKWIVKNKKAPTFHSPKKSQYPKWVYNWMITK